MNPFQSLSEYELFIYTLQQQFPEILSSTLVVARRRKFEAEVTGQILSTDGYRLTSTLPPTSSIIVSPRPN